MWGIIERLEMLSQEKMELSRQNCLQKSKSGLVEKKAGRFYPNKEILSERSCPRLE